MIPLLYCRFVGYVYVVEKYRRRGFARRMITTAHDVGVSRNWSGVIGLDALGYVESMYEKFDYKTAHKSTGYEGTVPPSAKPVGLGFGTLLLKA